MCVCVCNLSLPLLLKTPMLLYSSLSLSHTPLKADSVKGLLCKYSHLGGCQQTDRCVCVNHKGRWLRNEGLCVGRHLFPCYCVLWQWFWGYVGSLYMGVARMGEKEGRRFGEGKLDPGKRPTCLSVSQLNVF